MTTEHVVYTMSDWERAHTISLDEDRGHLHISGAIAGGVVYYCIVDVSMFDPNAPPPVIRAVGNSHASFVRTDRTYVSDLATDVFVYDIPLLLQSGSFPIPSGQLHLTQPNSHSSWVTEDASLCVAAFEATAGGLLAFTLPSPSPSLPFAGFQSTAGCPTGHTPHYAYGIGRCLYVAHYTDGFHFLELGATAANGFRPIAKYDTCAVGCPAGLPDVPVLGNSAFCGPYATGTTFAYYQGAWDVYPYQDSGVVYVTDTTSGLWALRIPTGHFHRTEKGYADPALSPPIPDVQPDGAAPRQGATSFAFRLTDLDPSYHYELVLGTQAMNLGQMPPVQYVTGTIVFQSPRVQPTASQHVFGWPANYPANSTLYAQVLAWTSATGGQLVAHSRLVDFQLLLP